MEVCGKRQDALLRGKHWWRLVSWDRMHFCAKAARNRPCEVSRILAQRLRTMSPTPNKIVEPPKKGEFEKSLTRLEEVVKRLESPELSLDEAMKLFEEGVKLSRDCQKQLEEAEGRVEILLKKADGKMHAEPFASDDEDSQVTR